MRKLRLNNSDYVIGGVCSGLADYMSTDVTWIRLLFAIGAFCCGTFVAVYLILWLVMSFNN